MESFKRSIPAQPISKKRLLAPRNIDPIDKAFGIFPLVKTNLFQAERAGSIVIDRCLSARQLLTFYISRNRVRGLVSRMLQVLNL
jgi:hypothetical protein